ncbi:hypothetical protein Fcan01_24520 [Folsomia candida]|uniref:Uncharacterized protein n=1 Tax=Folsomia candida TaxID=158441 RepID=A0A226D8V9_FOLCA|nr:hypothetical protein Fcan01_24520 [Folsomia candida]
MDLSSKISRVRCTTPRLVKGKRSQRRVSCQGLGIRRSSVYQSVSVPVMDKKTHDSSSLNMFCKILEFSCTWKVIPYNWNGVMKRFSPIDPTDLRGRVAIKLHSGIMYAVTIFSFVRLIMNVGKDRDEFPLMMKIVNVSWLLASIQVSVIFLNNWALRGDLMQYGNRVLEKIVKQGSQGKYPYSGALWTGMVLLFLNPLPHGLVAMHTPCAPNLLSSIVLSCACIGDHDHAKFGYGLLLLMGCWELYFMTVIFIQAFLAWAFVYLGVSSGTREMNGMRSMGIPLEVGIRTYLDLQRIINLLNVACKPYLATFPILLMSICSILLFGSIRLWDADFRADSVPVLRDSVCIRNVQPDLDGRTDAMGLRYVNATLGKGSAETRLGSDSTSVLVMSLPIFAHSWVKIACLFFVLSFLFFGCRLLKRRSSSDHKCSMSHVRRLGRPGESFDMIRFEPIVDDMRIMFGVVVVLEETITPYSGLSSWFNLGAEILLSVVTIRMM